MKTQKMDADPQRTQRMDRRHGSTQRRKPRSADAAHAADPVTTQRLGEPAEAGPAAAGGEKTMKMPKLDPAFKPEATQRLRSPRPPPTQRLDPKLDPAPLSNAESTQRLDDSIWKLQEAKRILQKITPK